MVPVGLEVKDRMTADVPSQLHEQVIQGGDDQGPDVRGQEQPDDLLQPAEPDRPAVYWNALRRQQFPSGGRHGFPSPQRMTLAGTPGSILPNHRTDVTSPTGPWIRSNMRVACSSPRS